MSVVLQVEGLTKVYGTGCPRCLELTGDGAGTNTCPRCGSVVACAGVSFEVLEGEILGLVGESGSGKSTVLQCIYLDVEATSGHVRLRGHPGNVLAADRESRRELRRKRMGMVYQDPQRGLHLDVTAGGNIAERLLEVGYRHVGAIRTRAASLLACTEIPVERMDDLPRHFSGGMQQRVQIAKALANNPQLLLLDELTNGLDVSVQAQILDLIKDIQRQTGVSIVLVSHDLRVVRLLAHRTMVMKNGRVVESGLTDQLMEDPQHPYTQLLVNCVL